MIQMNNKFCIKKASVVCLSFLVFMFPGCSEKLSSQEDVDTDEPDVAVVIDKNTAIANDDNEATTSSETDTRFTYTQPESNERSDDKVVIDATSTSFKALDTDNDKIVRQEEFYDGLYTLMDTDGNDTIDEAEFKEENSFFIRNSLLNSFAEWDTDGNKQISEEELKNKLSALIDITDGETLAQNLYIVWDTDDDDRIEKLELNNVVIRFEEDSN